MSPRKVARVPVANSSPANGEVDTWRTLPNLITVLRILLIIPFSIYVARGQDEKALGIFALAAVSDTLDGNLARWLKQTSKLGRLVDPVADKVLTGIAYVMLSLYRGGRPALPVWVMIVVVLRDVLILAGCWIVFRVAHDTSFRPTIFGKLNTLIELLVIACFLAQSLFPALAAGLPALYPVMTLSVGISLAVYVRQGQRMIQAASSR